MKQATLLPTDQASVVFLDPSVLDRLGIKSSDTVVISTVGQAAKTVCNIFGQSCLLSFHY